MIRRALPVVAMALFAVTLGAILAAAGDTLGYDFAVYRDASARIVSGGPAYDSLSDVVGVGGGYKYPPLLALAMVPFALIPGEIATWTWIALMTLTLLVAIALMPVRIEVRWVILILAAIDWPVLYSLKLGQVGPLLVLLFVVAWRSADRPMALGVSAAIGALVKVQPVLLLVPAVVNREWRTIGIALGAIAAAVFGSALLLGFETWADYVALVLRVSTPVTTPHLVTPGAVLYGMGVPVAEASLLQWLVVVLALAALVATAYFGSASQAIVVAATVSQFASPVTWDHYAIVLLIPVAYLLGRRMWAASLMPVSTSIALVGVVPPVVYPLLFVVALVAVALVGDDAPRRPFPGSARSAATGARLRTGR